MPSVSDVTISNLTNCTADGSAVVVLDGGDTVTDRGLCWNTTGLPTIADHFLSMGSDKGNFTTTLTDLVEGPTYYVRAYATNSFGIAYSKNVSSFKICKSFTAIHQAGLNGAPVSKMITYHPVNTNISGTSLCWLTQNLGADNQASLATDATEASAGWYWQFNRSQGYQYTTTRTPNDVLTPWVTSISESKDWEMANDPCHLLLGNSWRLPTAIEWTNADAPPQNWTTGANAFNSELKLHYAGVLNSTNGMIINRGTIYGYYWSSMQSAAATGSSFYITSPSASGGSVSVMYNGLAKAFACPVRCVRDQLVLSLPLVSDVTISNLKDDSADGSAVVVFDGGDTVTDRGLCWNTTGLPTVADNVLPTGSDKGAFTAALTGLEEGPTYYVRAYATNSQGTVYSKNLSNFKICKSFTAIHQAGFNGAPVSKTVIYHPVSSNMAGVLQCWLTQNLGADQQASFVDDNSEASAGWYWQFNRSQGYQYTTTRTPNDIWTPWINPITETANWDAGNDPCNLLLGLGWRLPTSTEWSNVDGAPQNWTTGADAYNSELKIHYAGILLNTTGVIASRGSAGNYWSSTQSGTQYGYNLGISSAASALASTNSKSFAFSVRCVRDQLVPSVPYVSDVTISDLTDDTADGSAIVTIDGGDFVTDRGLCWNTTGLPTIADHVLPMGSDKGNFMTTLTGLVDGPTYYVRAYATNSLGTAYSKSASIFKICKSFTAIHQAGFNGAPISKTITYHSVNTKISGTSLCWLTQNLGADNQASSVDDNSEASAGWYWQFNRSQGYQYTTVLTPTNTSTPWINPITESINWIAANDPCGLLLGSSWRIPTTTEWTNADAPPQNWTTGADAYNSELKMHYAGFLLNTTGVITGRGSSGNYWSSMQNGTQYGFSIGISPTTSTLTGANSKSFGFSVRCVRDQSVLSVPSVSDVTISDLTNDAANGSATVTLDGGMPVTERGLCWNTTGLPTIADNVLQMGSDKGDFMTTLTGLVEGPTYYVRAYATNVQGIAYSKNVSSFKICKSFTAFHHAGFNGAPVSKTVVYYPVSTNISGALQCWLTQNLGADQQASSVDDNSEASAGWYWQFNRSQGYMNDGVTRTPAASWIGTNDSGPNWATANDPCNLLLGGGWRIPTGTEWLNVDAAPQNWTTGADAYNSVLKLHYAGILNNTTGVVQSRGISAYYWSSIPFDSQNGSCLYIVGNSSVKTGLFKAYALPVRCLRDQLVLSVPSVSDVTISNLTDDTANASAVVTIDGVAPVTERGLCWNTTGLPTVADNVLPMGSDKGEFIATLTGLVEGPTYYVRAYAINSQGIVYSMNVSSFKICKSFTVVHQAGINGAPVSKTVVYHPISTNISGVAQCWLTQNLGADQQASSVDDATEASAGWFWQFNRSQGYQHDGVTRTPATSWIGTITESANWAAGNDPCNLLLGGGWRIPTSAEWVNVDGIPQNWTTGADAYNSVLKLHYAGLLSSAAGTVQSRGASTDYWSSTMIDAQSGYCLLIASNSSVRTAIVKANAAPVRCLKD